MKADIIQQKEGVLTSDGAGVRLTRVLGHDTVGIFDPFLMLDAFDSRRYEDYQAGFPTHPHRGIETLTYMSEGKVTHRDSLGNQKTIGDGAVQWMTAGSGILHSEFFEKSPHLLGVQLWLNMPSKDKMAPPTYREITRTSIPTCEEDGVRISVYIGRYRGRKGVPAPYHPLNFYVLRMDDRACWYYESGGTDEHTLFFLQGAGRVNGIDVAEKTALHLSAGDITVEAQGPVELIVLGAAKLKEPIAWAGPVVMNTQEEIRTAYREWQEGTFIKERLQ